MILPADGKSMGFPASVYRNAGGYINCRNIQQAEKLVSIVGKGVSWMNDKLVKLIMLLSNALLSSLGSAGSMVAKGISAGSSAVDSLFGPNKQQSKQQFKYDFKTFQQDDFLRKNVPIDITSEELNTNRQLMKTHVPKTQQNLETIENLQKTFAIQPFQNDGQHHFSIKEIKPELQMPSLFVKGVIISLTDPDHDVTQIQNSFIKFEFTMNLLLDNKFEQFSESYRAGTFIFVGLKSSAQLIREYTLYHRGRTTDGFLQNDSTTEQFIYNIIKPKSEKNNNRFVHSLYENVRKDDISHCEKYLSIKDISDALASQTAAPYFMPVNFSVSIPLDDLLIFSAFSEYLNSLFSDLKIQFKINPNAFVFSQIDPVISMARYYTINKDKLLRSGQDELKGIDLFFRNWSFTFQYINMFTKIRCTADLITGIRAEELTPSGLKNLVCDIKSVTISVRNYFITVAVANMCGYKASQECLNRVRQFYSSRPFVVPAQCIETWAFPSGATLTGLRTSQNIPLSHVTDMCLLFLNDAIQTTCFENPCYQNIQLSTLGRNFPDFPMNTLNEQLFTMQMTTNNLDNIFEAIDEYEDSFTTPRGNSTRRYNSITDYTSFIITLQCDCNSNGAVDTYYNVDFNGKHPLLPILCSVHDIFRLFSPADGRSCVQDTSHSFDEVIGQVTA
ncbi:MAG: hypothetical protein EZS28_011493 [Streblomastix strix]|uniref:Uncharacterized protein n=1 Tax=Streblomastix strix TaxID=222440 RepID=A0A5J4WEJ2_9EUKA|nr:MAG: hypothetical protein EZS28_011493 [Streblomastix strix]